MPVRIYDIAKKFGIESKEVLAKAKALGITAAIVPSSSLDRVTAEFLEGHFELAVSKSNHEKFRSFELGNFKAFAETQKIPIRPLTLIFGANSSGKSSVIHGLLLMREALEKGETQEAGRLDVFKTRLGGDAVDLGGFRQYVHRHKLDEKVEWSGELDVESLKGSAYAVFGNAKELKVMLRFGMAVNDKGVPLSDSSPKIESYEILADGVVVIRLVQAAGAIMNMARFHVESFKPLVRATLVATTSTPSLASAEDEVTVTEVVEQMGRTLKFECDGLLPSRQLGQDYGFLKQAPMAAIGKETRQEDLKRAAHLVIPNAIGEAIRGVNAELRKQLERVVYLGPVRSFPARHLAFAEEGDRNWYAGGGYAWDMVKRNKVLREGVNGWLNDPKRMETPYRLVVERLITSAEAKLSIEHGLESLAPDLVAKLMGEVGTAKVDTDWLLTQREEIVRKWGECEHSLKDTRETIATLQARQTVLEQQKAEKIAALERASLQRNLLTYVSESLSSEERERLETLEKEVTSLDGEINFVIGGKKAVDQILETTKITEVKEEARLQKLKEEMAEIFNELQANLDIQEFANRLHGTLIERSNLNAVEELMLIDGRTETVVTHRDVGIGVSQVLPVLVHALADRNRIVAIEQPEIHLHPKLQADLGDLFIESALGERKNTFLLETHSEHLILRILRRVRDTTAGTIEAGSRAVRPEDVTVMFVEPTPKGSVIRHLPVTPDGDFGAPWPGGFFADRFKDLP